MAHRFEMVGGHPVLDFLNTINDWTADTPTDYLADGAEAAAFGEQAGVLSRAESRRMATLVHGPELGRLRVLRAVLERALQALLDARAPVAADLDALDALRTEVSRSAKLRLVDGRLTSEVGAERTGGSTLRLRLAAAALALLE
ncbi:MAG: ABATE domain-containing protein, partial [Cytophagaceae bacterium]|nr:ABATE domain-containing protein [Gemmatimonadaceae bacterium]